MANIVCGTVIFYGNKNGINVIEKVLNDKGTISIREFIDSLSLDNDYDGDCRYTIYDFNISDDHKSICLNVELAWGAHEDLWKLIANKFDLKWTGRFDFDDLLVVYNDENKEWFKEDYVLDAEDSPIGDYKEFETSYELTEYLKNKTDIELTPEEWNEKFYEDEWLTNNLGGKWENAYARVWIIERENW